MSKEDVRLKMGGWVVDCPNCRVALIEGSRDGYQPAYAPGLGDRVPCHNCHADFLIEKISYRLRRVI